MGLLALHNRKRWFVLLLTVSLIYLALAYVATAPRVSFAQDQPVPEEQQQVENAPAAEGEGGAAAGEEDQNFIVRFFVRNIQRVVYIFFTSILFNEDSWWIGIVFLLLSITGGILLLVLLMDLRLGNAIPLGFVEEFTNIVNRRQFKQAFDLCRADNSFLARVLTSGMGRLQYGIDDARHAAGNTVESIRRGKEHLVNYVALIGTVGPLIGLFGTVWGMIGAFMVISQSSGEPRPQAIAGQISQSLATTFVGILVAVPALFFNTFFRNRLTRITMDTSNLSDDLLTQMYHNSRKPGAGGAPTPAPAPSAGGSAPARASAGGNANSPAIRPAE